MIELAAGEYRNYYTGLRDSITPEKTPAAWQRIAERFSPFYERNSGLPACTLKAELYEICAEEFEPFLTPHSPFFFESGLRYPLNWGTPDGRQPGSFLLAGRQRAGAPCPEESRKLDLFHLRTPEDASAARLWIIHGGFDADHHSPGYTELMKHGFRGVLEQLAALPEQNAETEAMARGVRALLRAAERFGEKAAELLKSGGLDAEGEKNLRLVAETARRIPAEPPATFYEGLQMILFVREMIASFDNIGLSVLGRPDKILYELYRNDLKRGVLTPEEAERLIALWMLPHDIKTFVRDREWPENSTTLELGGCDESGRVVYNDLTRLFLNVHRNCRFITPKLNCRCSASAPREYLESIADALLDGHNNFACLNDDVLIPAQIRNGKSFRDAANYVNGGCQETICEGTEHSAGAYFYFNLAETLHLFLCGPRRPFSGGAVAVAAELLPEKMKAPERFCEFYRKVLDGYDRVLRSATGWTRKKGELFSELHPSPLFSTTLADCIRNRKDYTAGGARYNPSGIALVGLPDVVNSLYAVKKACFDDGFVSFETLCAAIASNWPPECEPLRQRLRSLPRWGGGDPEVQGLAGRFSADLTALARSLPNERGEFFQPSYFVYWTFKQFGDATGALPDGRRLGDYLAQGIAPSRAGASGGATEVLDFLAGIDFRDVPGNAVLDLQMPVSAGMGREPLAGLLRSAFRLGVPTLQLNFVDPAELKDARIHPERHENLLVRISGLSALFVRLTPEVQAEIVSRYLFN